MKKKLLKIFISLCAVICLIFAGARYGWRLFGFRYCANPDIIYISSVEQQDNQIVITGGTAASAPAFIGYTYSQWMDTIQLGVKYNVLFGFFKRDGGFTIRIPCDGKGIQQIYIVNGQKESLKWDSSEGGVFG